jgi:hypothetical protein
MGSLPRVGAHTRERVAREFDDRGPDVCRTEIALDLEANNPELLDIAQRCARDVGDFARIMTGFCMFYRVLTVEGQGMQSRRLPGVSRATRASIAERIDTVGSRQFTSEVVTELERGNPELLMLSHHFAEQQSDYVEVMQGFALLYACLLAEARHGRGPVH